MYATLLALAGSAAWAVDDEPVPLSGDVALTFGRNVDQGLNVVGLIGELKADVHPLWSVGGRVGVVGGAGFGVEPRAYVGFPVLAKGERFLGTSDRRGFLGLGAGLTFVTAAGVDLAPTDPSASAYAVSGPLPTLMPEVGVDLGRVRLSTSWSWMPWAPPGLSGRIDPSGLSTGRAGVPGLSALTLQAGGRFR